MKKYSIFQLLIASALMGIALTGVQAATMHDKHTESQMMSTHEATHAMIHQNMSEKSMHNMMELMEQMRNNVAEMSQMMEKHKMLNQMQLSEAAKMMNHMSDSMREMSKKMQKGEFDDKAVAMMKERNKEMQQMMEEFHKQLGTK